MKKIIQIRIHRLLIKSTSLLALVLAVISAEATDIGADISASVGYSDNIVRTELDHIDEFTGVLGLRFDLDQSTARIDANIRSNVYFLSYQKDVFDDEVIASLAAEVEISLIEERLNWYVADYYGQQQLNVFQPKGPGNRENVNYFTTGPNIRLPLGHRTNFGADLRYSKVDYEVRTDDNFRVSARGWLGRDIREAQTLSINAFGESIEFDDPLFTQDFDRIEGYFRWDAGSGRGSSGLARPVGRNVFGFDVGYTELRVETETASGYLVRADWTRTITARSTLDMRAGTRYSDQGDIFGDYQNISRSTVGDIEDIDGDGRPFRNNFFGLSYNTERPLAWMHVQLGWSQEDYELGFDRDRDLLWGRIILDRDVSDNMFFNLDGRFDVRDYKYASRRDDDLSIFLTFGYRFGPVTSLALQYGYFQRNSTAVGGDYKENRVFLTFTYTPVWGQMRRR